MPDQRLLICPYCGETQPERDRCRACAGLFEPLSRQATHNAMGPWFIRDDQQPHRPGCSYETLVKLVQRGKVTRYTIVRGPTTRQFWTIAKRVPGISHFFGACYQCDASVDAEDRSCHACGATFGGFLDRNFLGLPEYRPLPWEGDQASERRPEVEPGEPSDWRQQSMAVSGGPRGISSFATDEELFGEQDDQPHDGNLPRPARSPVDSLEQDAEQQAAPAATATVRAQPEAVPATDDEPDRQHDAARNTAIRALQRTVTKQQRTIRMLAYTAIAIGALTVVIALLWLDSRSADDRRLEHAAPAESAATDEPWELPELVPSAPGEHAGDSEAERPSPSLDDEAADAHPAKSATWTDDHQRTLEEAIDLVERAEDEQRELLSRIDDLERAIAVMERLKREVEESALPEEMPRHLRDARRWLERLRLQEFFP